MWHRIDPSFSFTCTFLPTHTLWQRSRELIWNDTWAIWNTNPSQKNWNLGEPIKCDPNILMRATTFWPKGLMTSSWMSFPCINCNRSNLGYASVLPKHEVQKISPKSSSLEITQFGWRHFLTKYRQIYLKPLRVPCIYCIYLFLRAITSYHAPATSIEMRQSSPVQMTHHSVWWLYWWRYWQFCQAKRGKLPHSTDVRQPYISIHVYIYIDIDIFISLCVFFTYIYIYSPPPTTRNLQRMLLSKDSFKEVISHGTIRRLRSAFKEMNP